MALRGGHVRKRGQAWQIVIQLPPCPVTGKRNRIYKSVDGNKREAEKIMRQMMADIETGGYVKDTTLTVESYLRQWHTDYIKPFKSPTTSATYLYNLENYVIPVFGKLGLQQLTTAAIQRWINNLMVTSPLRNRPLAPKTIRNLFMNLSAALKRAVQLEYLRKNPAENIELPKCPKYKPEVYDSQEIAKLIQILRGSELELAFMILITLGLRRGELIALTWSDIDFDNQIVHISKSRVKVKRNHAVTKSPKSEAGNRSIMAPDMLIELLRRGKRDYLKRQLRYGKDFKHTDLVVCHDDGSPFAPDYFTHKFKQLLDAHGLRQIRLHDLRHSNATFMLQIGVPAKVMQKRLGHSTFGTTMDIYASVLDSMQEEAADTLNAGLESILSKAL